jgi:antitoxin VapB
MAITRVFKSGNSQAVRLPTDFKIKSGEVEIFRRKNDIIIREVPANLGKAFSLLSNLGKGFFGGGRKDSPAQKRKF